MPAPQPSPAGNPGGDWRAKLFAAVSPLEAGVRNLKVNNFRSAEEDLSRPGRTAAVLVPVIDQQRPEVVLTRRSIHLPQHAGQVSFPGGAAELDDGTAVNTALREAWEEVGIMPEAVTPIGFLDRFDTVSDYRVLPVVGLVQPPVKWKLDRREVEEVFTMPLEVALDRARYEEHITVKGGVSYTGHRIEWQGHLVWGLTAAMLMNLQRRMDSG